jgi:hypothetical protein
VAVNESTRLGFLTAHLEAHEGEEKYAKRCSSFRDILRGTRSSVTPCRYDAALASHFMFSMGDLNFRTKLPTVEAGSTQHIKICHELTAKKDWVTLNKHDELSKAVREKECLVGFRTPYCNFDPTFKVSRQNGYEYNVKRSPSYTDRILFKTGDQLEPALKAILYEPVGTFTTSDYKPIRAVFDIRLNEKLRLKPALNKTGKRASLDKKNSQGLPEVSQASTVEIVRENLHMFASSIQCNIDQTEYNKSRKSNDNKIDVPSPFVSFVSTPSEAIRTDASKRGNMWNKLGFRTKSSKLNSKSDGNSTKKGSSKSMTGWPGTAPLPSTFKANWNNEEVHFVVRTHHQDGVPIELSGALLHISVFDNKGSEPKLLGSFSLNLARLIEMTTESQENLTDNLPDDLTNGIPITSGWSYSQRAGPSAALCGAWKEDMPTPVRTVAKSLNQAKKPLSPTVPGRGHLRDRGQPKESLSRRGQPGKQGSHKKPLSSTVPDQLGKQTPPKKPLPSTVPDHGQLRKHGPPEKSISSTVLDRSQPGKQGPPKQPLPCRVPDHSQLRKQGSPKQPLVSTVPGRGQPGKQGPPKNPLPSRVPDHGQLRKQDPPEKPLSSTVLDHGQPRKQGPPEQELSSTVPGRGQPGKQGPPNNHLPSRVQDHSQLKKRGPPKTPLSSTVPERSQPGKQGPPKQPLSSTGLNRSPLKRRGSRTVLTSGPSHSMRNTIGEAGSMGKLKDKLKELNFFSLKLDEPLTESGKEVGRIMCRIDAWWMEDNEPAKNTPDKK